MRAVLGLGLCVVLALAGAAAWVGLSRVWDVGLLALLACVVGGLAGYGMAVGSRALGGPLVGLAAAVVCLLACLSAKGTIAWLRASDYMQEHGVFTDQDVYFAVVDETFAEMADEGTVSWDDYDADGDVPPVVLEAARERFDSMSRKDIDRRIAAMSREWGADESATGMVSALSFLFSWGLLDIVCVCSAVGTAFKIGSFHRPEQEEEVPAWALGQASATGNPLAPTAGEVGMVGAVVGGAIGGAPAGSPSGPLPPIPQAQPGPTIGRQARETPAAEPEDAASSFWTKLGSEPPARNTPSLRREPKVEGSHDRAEAA